MQLYCSNNLSNIPLTFMLGFYVSLVVDRWWKQYKLLPWPDSFAIMVTGKRVTDIMSISKYNGQPGQQTMRIRCVICVNLDISSEFT